MIISQMIRFSEGGSWVTQSAIIQNQNKMIKGSKYGQTFSMICKNIAFSSQKTEAVPSNLFTRDFLLSTTYFLGKYPIRRYPLQGMITLSIITCCHFTSIQYHFVCLLLSTRVVLSEKLSSASISELI